MKPTSFLALVLVGALGCTVHAPGPSDEAGGLANGSFTAITESHTRCQRNFGFL